MFVNVPWTDTDTNTHYKAVPHAGTNSSTSATATTNGNTYINIVENDSRSGGINIKGTGATTVTSDTSGVITINSTDNEFTIKEIRFGKTKMLLPRNREYPPVEITDNSRVVIIGPVISVIRKYR